MLLKARHGTGRIERAQRVMKPQWGRSAWGLQRAWSAMLPMWHVLCCRSGAVVHGDSKELGAPCCQSGIHCTAEVAPRRVGTPKGSEHHVAKAAWAALPKWRRGAWGLQRARSAMLPKRHVLCCRSGAAARGDSKGLGALCCQSGMRCTAKVAPRRVETPKGSERRAAKAALPALLKRRVPCCRSQFRKGLKGNLCVTRVQLNQKF